ncbi:MAG: 2OG-Fe(II) oxygenase family protein, partial [Burkholderiaceae bacterium]
AIAIDLHNRGYLGQGEARMYGATRNDLKEVFFFGRDLAPDDPDIVAGVPLCAVNQWPDANLLPLFRPTVVNYLQAAAITGSQLLRGFASLLEAPEDFFESRYQRPMARGQLIHYPAPPEQAPDDQFGVAPHTDFGCITMLYQHTPGLEVQSRSGQWIAVPPIPGTVVINIGDLLERWSNGRLPSTKHRVRNLTGASRYSIAVFYDPSATAVVDPADLIHSKSHAEPGFAPMTAANYILSRSQKVFAQFDKSISQGVSSSSGM